MRRWSVLVFLLLLSFVVGCSAAGNQPGSDSSAADNTGRMGTVSPGPTQDRLAPLLAERHAIRLACDDALASASTNDAEQVNGAGSAAWSKLGGINLAAQPKLRIASRELEFVKALLSVAPNAQGRVTLRINTPRTAGLFYVPATTWAHGPTPRLISARSTRSVIAESCKVPVSYPGGLVVSGPSCVVISLKAAGRPAKTVTVPVAQQHC
jgi:hypothetical protein